MLAAAAIIWIFVGRNRRGYDRTAAYWLACGTGIWLCLYLPLPWVIQSAMLVIAGVSFLFAFVPVWQYHRRRSRAWPEHLEELGRPFKPPGGLITSVTSLSLLVFFLGLCYITSVQAARSCLLMGVSLLLLVQYDFRVEAALAGMVLVSLGIVSAFLDLTGAAGKPMPTILNLVIIPLAYLAFHWIWLGNLWRAQIIDGVPLTAAARLVHLTRHVGIILLSFATLLAVKLALWPLMPAASVLDNGTARFVLLGVAFGVLLAGNVWIGRPLRGVSLEALAAMNFFGLAVAYLTRMPKFFHEVVQPNWHWMILGYLLVVLAAGAIWRYWNTKRRKTETVEARI